MTYRFSALLCLLLLVVVPHLNASDLRIETFTQGGALSWQDVFTNGHYCIEWCSSLSESNWHSGWADLEQISATGGTISAQVPLFYRIVHYPEGLTANSLELRLIPGGGQPGGCQYAFYMGKYETTTDQYVEFLNSAEANPSSSLGRNMFYTSGGDVYMDDTASNSEMMFDISDSYVFYDNDAELGERYWCFPDAGERPITGVSWYGALKFCNWLTVIAGRGEGERCYSEGTHPTNWIPANVTYAEWADGYENQDRMDWVTDFDGFRLPMDDHAQNASYFNEFYKAAAWDGTLNRTYGFGRDTIDAQDANYSSSSHPYQPGTTPVGYYDGTDHGGIFQTRSNSNLYAICDLSGNVREWVSDTQDSGDTLQRGLRSGHYSVNTSSLQCAYRVSSSPATTDESCGFRVVTATP